jgi:RNA polymerase sigma-70 factor (ECF subfamily)
MLYTFDHHKLENFQRRLAPGEPTDEQLMTRIKTQDEQALEILYRRHLPLVRTVVSRVLNNDSDVDDLAQQVFLEVWRQAEHYCENKGKALGWLVTLARRRAIDRVRKRQAYCRARERFQMKLQHDPDACIGHSVATEAASAETREIFNEIISHLPAAQQEALHLAFDRGLSQREIAAQIGIPLGTIKTRLELAIRKVRSAILALGGEREWLPSYSHA